MRIATPVLQSAADLSIHMVASGNRTTALCALVRNDVHIEAVRADLGAVSEQISMSLRGARSATWQSVLIDKLQFSK